ncbi:Toprim sub domain-containing protein [Paenibacillus jiagnxiensis]|uniref:Toprim sub domain-containing protein n=1 Tax=Paenibacillus jiagnxiensis TaxID=3228926 RepID=UPI0033BD10BA
MKETSILSFIKQHYVKAGEELQPGQQLSGYFELDIMKISARTYKRSAMLSGVISDEGFYEPAHPALDWLLSIFHSTQVKKSEQDLYRANPAINQETIHNWFQKGFIYRKSEYGQDGRTMKRSAYVIGYALSLLHKQRREAEQTEMSGQLNYLCAEARRLYDELPCALILSKQQRLAIEKLTQYMEVLIEALHEACHLISLEPVSQKIDINWRSSKQIRYIQFLLALCSIRMKTGQFDWKEIGAAYFGQIGGSKVFDKDKKDFLDKLERGVDIPLSYLGLVSTGAITPIYFAGALQAGDLNYPQGYLHATTDLAVYELEMATSCKHMWLVENRALLTRMCSDPEFLFESESLVIGLDGQLRSSHRKLVHDILQHSPSIEQVLVWCDTDQAGLHIASSVRKILDHFPLQSVKWILTPPETRQARIFNSWVDYESQLQATIENNRPTEQEEFLGGRELWTTWIKS